ncbi:hypothetical protein [Vibrio furnissii]|uniref:hypothetical protein n=1 Tax=Vibrio furnissii TaxID=29494 RepID=UPI001EEB0304|nr:hypothetical protein [Vibrio furnissii]MCG6233093.1 hypothetical protein [Vibrio furnissii]MCG6258953.1 hypothetical protein [Vibrio furnissii]
MSLTVIAGLASLALEYGPTAIRGISSMFGGSETADKVADAVEKADAMFGATKEQKTLSITRDLQSLPPESFVELQRINAELEKEKTRRQELTLADNQAEHHETQETIRAGDKAEDPYIRKTRPLMARQSFWGMIAYIFIFEAIKAYVPTANGADPWMALTIGTPAFAYLGLRTIDGFAKYPKGSGDKVMNAIGSVIKGRS